MIDTSNMSFSAVPVQAVDFVWDTVAPMLQMAIDTSPGGYTTDSVREDIMAGRLGLWVALEGGDTPVAAVTTRIVDLPEMRVLTMDWVGGSKMANWLGVTMDTLERYAKDNDCTQLQGYGRKAWERWMKPRGWEPAYTTYKKDLIHG